MSPFEELQPSRVLLVGDLHANLHHTLHVIEHAKREGAEAILQVGDVVWDMRDNFDRSPNYMDLVSEAASEAGIPFAFARGNHDNATKLAEYTDEHGCTAIPVRPGLWYLPNGYRWVWSGVSFLALGGAHSVDKPWRRPHLEWWPGETITSSDALRACEGGPADVMICHDVPAGVHIPCIEGNPHGFPAREIEAAERNRRVLRAVVDVVRPSRIFSGHYHCRLTAELVGADYRATVDILDMDGTPLDRNTLKLDLS
ncbi:metallophosphoesterase [Nocardia higoensis]|uniref:Metallophosphoesterase n=1 Tax=Nocardia higoensis TaxID=228599 RepID=A0ABS0DI94_9NOCA|nr:metallophosphoesterase [Nocardia higoensis]MBF6358171.1 metallophosphoesterase [Nocardia higoensis]